MRAKGMIRPGISSRCEVCGNTIVQDRDTGAWWHWSKVKGVEHEPKPPKEKAR